MNSLLARLRDTFTGRDPADVAAEAVYRAMCAAPPYVAIAKACEATDRAGRAALLATVDDATRSKVVAYMKAPPATRERDRRLAWARADSAKRFPALLRYYSKNLAQWITDWGMTHDPRLAGKTLPFELFPRQVEMVAVMLDSYRNKEPLSILKSRDSGASWVACALLVGLAIFEDGFTAIIGSQLEVKIDQSGTTGTLFHKIRMFLEYLPPEFRGGWTLKSGSANMRVWFPNGSTIQGEAGEAIGRGGRASVACLDEYAHLEHPDLIDAALMATTETKWYISSVNGTDNPFARRVREGKTKVFMYTWRDDPRKLVDPEWAAKKIAADGQRKFNQEYCCDFLAGNEDQMFPQEQIAVMPDAHAKLGLEPTGEWFASFDVGNGGDESCVCIKHGNVAVWLEPWSSSTNLVKECRRAFAVLDKFGVTEMCADAVGVGAGIEGIVQMLNDERVERDQPRITVQAFKGSEGPHRPDSPTVPGSKVKNKDYYPNRKSQGADWLRYLVKVTFQKLAGDAPNTLDDLYISISTDIPADIRNRLQLEMGQVTCEENGAGKLRVDKYGGGDSPNIFDALCMAFAPRQKKMQISGQLLARLDKINTYQPGSSNIF